VVLGEMGGFYRRERRRDVEEQLLVEVDEKWTDSMNASLIIMKNIVYNTMGKLKGINSHFLPLDEVVQYTVSSPEGKISRDKA
jgi:hypothetical protein